MNYSLIIISLLDYKHRYRNHFKEIAYQHHICNSDSEILYDWLITEALSNILQLKYSGRVIPHYKHDVCSLIYSDYGLEIEYFLLQQIDAHKLNFLKGETVKVLVAGDSLILARGVLTHV